MECNKIKLNADSNGVRNKWPVSGAREIANNVAVYK